MFSGSASALRALAITALAGLAAGCEGEALYNENDDISTIHGVSDACEELAAHIDGDRSGDPDLFVLSVESGDVVDVIVDRAEDTVLVLASAERVDWNVTSTGHVRVITVEGDHDAIERAVLGTNLPLAGYHGCRRSGSFGIFD